MQERAVCRDQYSGIFSILLPQRITDKGCLGRDLTTLSYLKIALRSLNINHTGFCHTIFTAGFYNTMLAKFSREVCHEKIPKGSLPISFLYSPFFSSLSPGKVMQYKACGLLF